MFQNDAHMVCRHFLLAATHTHAHTSSDAWKTFKATLKMVKTKHSAAALHATFAWQQQLVFVGSLQMYVAEFIKYFVTQSLYEAETISAASDTVWSLLRALGTQILLASTHPTERPKNTKIPGHLVQPLATALVVVSEMLRLIYNPKIVRLVLTRVCFSFAADTLREIFLQQMRVMIQTIRKDPV